MITDSVLEGLVQRNAQSINGFYRPVTSVDPDTYLREVVPIAAETEHPIPVVDDGGQVVGEVDRTALLSGISEGGMSGNGAGSEQES
jgi:CBS domain-containing protein